MRTVALGGQQARAARPQGCLAEKLAGGLFLEHA